MKSKRVIVFLCFSCVYFLLYSHSGNGQVTVKRIIGKWEMQKHFYENDTTNRNPSCVSRVFIFLANGSYKFILTRNDIVKGVFVEDGKWKLNKNGTILFLHYRKEKDSPRLPDLEIELVRLSIDKLEMKEMGVSGEEGVYGISHYKRVK